MERGEAGRGRTCFTVRTEDALEDEAEFVPVELARDEIYQRRPVQLPRRGREEGREAELERDEVGAGVHAGARWDERRQRWQRY